MSLPRGRQYRLPKHFPAGTVYVVEGCGGQNGRLEVSSRYVVMPGGQRLEIPTEFGRSFPMRSRYGRHLRRHGKNRSAAGSKEFRAGAKKFVVVAGTSHQERR
jgi:hypothetical protein